MQFHARWLAFVAHLSGILLFIFILSGFQLVAQLPSNVSPVGLVAWYGLNGNVNDASINGNHCTNYGATLTTDRNGNANSAYAFDGVSNYLERTTPSYTFSQTGNFSFSIWVKKASANAGIMMMSGTGTSGVFIWLLQGNATGTSYFGTNMQQSAWIWSTCPYSLSQWEHYVGVYTGSNGLMKLYKNGVFQSSATYTYTSATASADGAAASQAAGTATSEWLRSASTKRSAAFTQRKWAAANERRGVSAGKYFNRVQRRTRRHQAPDSNPRPRGRAVCHRR